MTATPIEAHATAARSAVVEALTRVLFEDTAAEGYGHAHWRAVVSGPEFADCGDLPHDAAAARGYDRLRVVNASLADPLALTADAAALAAAHEWAGTVDSSLTTVLGIHYNLFLGSLHDHDPDPRRPLDPFLAMERIGTFLCTEVDHGNDAAHLETQAVHDPATGGFVLHTPHPGAAKFMPNTSLTGGPKSAVVAARLLVEGRDLGVFLFLVDLHDGVRAHPGVTVRHLPVRTGSAVDHCLTAFDHVLLPREALLEGRQGRLGADGVLSAGTASPRKRFLASIGRVSAGKLSMSGAAVGAARAALALAVGHAERRRISDLTGRDRVPLAAHRSHTDRLTSAAAAVCAATFLHRATVRRWTTEVEHGREGCEQAAAVAKAWITWTSRRIALECRERCGAQGLFPAARLGGYPIDIEGTVTAEGDNLAVWVKAAAERVLGLGDGPDAAVEDAPGAGADPCTPEGLHCQLRALAEELRARAAARLRAPGASGALHRWNRAQAVATEALTVHAEAQAAAALLAAAGRTAARQAEAGALLRDLGHLFLLDAVRPRTGELIAAGLLPAGALPRLEADREALHERLAPRLPELTAAFDLPETVTGALPLRTAELLADAVG